MDLLAADGAGESINQCCAGGCWAAVGFMLRKAPACHPVYNPPTGATSNAPANKQDRCAAAAGPLSARRRELLANARRLVHGSREGGVGDGAASVVSDGAAALLDRLLAGFVEDALSLTGKADS